MTMEEPSIEFQNLSTALYECPDDPDQNEYNQKQIHEILTSVHNQLETYLLKDIKEPAHDAIGIFCIDYFERLIRIDLNRDEHRIRFQTLNRLILKNLNIDLFRYIITSTFCSIYSHDMVDLKRLRLIFIVNVISYAESNGILITTVFSTDADMTLYNFIDYTLTMRVSDLQILALRIAYKLLPALDNNIANKFFPHEANMREALVQFKSEPFQNSVDKFLSLIKIGAQRVVSLPLIDVKIGHHVVRFTSFVTADASLPSIYACFDCSNQIFSIYILANGEKSTVISVHKNKIASARRAMKSQHLQTKIMLVERVPTFFIDSITGRSITCTFREDVASMLENIEEEFVNFFLHEKEPRQKKQYENTSSEKANYYLDNCDGLSYNTFYHGIQTGYQSSPEYSQSVSLSLDALDLSFSGENYFIINPDTKKNNDAISFGIFDSGIQLDKDFAKISCSHSEINTTVNKSDIIENLLQYNRYVNNEDTTFYTIAKNGYLSSNVDATTSGNYYAFQNYKEIAEDLDEIVSKKLTEASSELSALSTITEEGEMLKVFETKLLPNIIQENKTKDVEEIVDLTSETTVDQEGLQTPVIPETENFELRSINLTSKEKTIQYSEITNNKNENIAVKEIVTTSNTTYSIDISHIDVDARTHAIQREHAKRGNPMAVDETEDIFLASTIDLASQRSDLTEENDTITQNNTIMEEKNISDKTQEISIEVSDSKIQHLHNNNIFTITHLSKELDITTNLQTTLVRNIKESQNIPVEFSQNSEKMIDLPSIITALDKDIENHLKECSNTILSAKTTFKGNSKQIVAKPKTIVKARAKFDSKSICKIKTYQKRPIRLVDSLYKTRREFRKLTLFMDSSDTSMISELKLFNSLPTGTKKMIVTSISQIRNKVRQLANHLEDYILELNNS